MSIQFEKLKARLFANPEVKAEYDALAPEFEIAAELFKTRLRAGLSQAEPAERMGTSQSTIARLENGHSLPSTKTLLRYAEATGSKFLVRAIGRVRTALHAADKLQRGTISPFRRLPFAASAATTIPINRRSQPNAAHRPTTKTGWIVMHGKFLALVAAFGVAVSGPALAAWPEDKPVEVIIGFAPGGGTDVMARKLMPFVEKRLDGNAKFVVLNRPGAGGEIAFAAIARGAPDGYMMGAVNVPSYNFLPMTRKTQYSMDEIRLVARVVDDPGVMVVRADSKFTNLGDVLAELRSKPGSVTFGHNGGATNGHLAIRTLATAAKVEPNEISYRGTGAQRTDLLGGHLEVGMVSLSEVPELHGTNKGALRAIAVLSKKRSPSLPDVPTAEEAGAAVASTASAVLPCRRACLKISSRSLKPRSPTACATPNISRVHPATSPCSRSCPARNGRSALTRCRRRCGRWPRSSRPARRNEHEARDSCHRARRRRDRWRGMRDDGVWEPSQQRN